MKNKTRYQKPKITAVELDPRQAVLAVCAVYEPPGVWYGSPMGGKCAYGEGIYGGFPCSYGLKGTLATQPRVGPPDAPGS